MKGIRRTIICLTAMLFATACGNADFEFSNYHCNFNYNNATHQDATLASALNQLSPGIFCRITYEMRSGGVKYFVFKSNMNTSTSVKFDAEDERLGSKDHIGMNNGLIVGYGNISMPSQLYAYDNQCPNCYDQNAIPVRNYPLSMTTTGSAICSTCKRQYNMNGGGYIEKGDTGKKLERYRISCSGAFGTLSVY